MPMPVPATPETISEAAERIRSGGLVAFPTETVYGLGANALDADAVARIFAAKGRPATNPVIAHVGGAAGAAQIAEVSERARRLIDAFWPGPLTLVLPKLAIVPDVVTAGGPTVAVRAPRHPVALALLRAAGVPIAAPSANRSESLSPTRAEHVAASLGDAVDMILDGGPCEVGLESTVVDMTVTPARVLRPGMADLTAIAQVLGEAVEPTTALSHPGRGEQDVARSPGQMARHYAPRTPLVIVDDVAGALAAAPDRVAILVIDEHAQDDERHAFTDAQRPLPAMTAPCAIALPANPILYAARLYEVLHALDAAGADVILVQAPPHDRAWAAIWDRLRRAAAPR